MAALPPACCRRRIGGLRSALALLRDLDPPEQPLSWDVVQESGDTTLRFTPTEGRNAELHAAPAEFRGVRYYVPRVPRTDEPYPGVP